ncbi:MAG TPA: hypothetical protein VLO13_00195 [Halomonas sp.]|nr:hypothetical protein [Halomonas sp.]
MKELGLGLGLVVGVAGLWAIPMALITTFSDEPGLTAYRDNILFRQTGKRLATAWHHVNPWHYYIISVLPWAWLPLILGLPWLIPSWWHRARRVDARVLLPLSGTLLVVLFFSLSPGKRGVYMLPTSPLLVLSMAPLLPGLLCKRGLHWLATGLLALLGSTFLTAGLLGVFGLPELTELAAKYNVTPWTWWILLGVTAAGLLFWLQPRRGMLGLAAWLAVFWVLWSTLGYQQLNSTRSPRDMMQEVVSLTGPDAWLALPDFGEEFLLQARQPSVHFGYHTKGEAELRRAFAWLQEAPDQRWMLVDQRKETSLACADLGQARALGHQNSHYWWLIPGSAFAGCEGDVAAAPLFVAPTSLGHR